MFVFSGACKAYSGPDRNMPCGKRPSIIQHCHPETLWGGEYIHVPFFPLSMNVTLVHMIVPIHLVHKSLFRRVAHLPLQVFALICDAENPQVFTVEFIRGQIRRFSSTERYAHFRYLHSIQ